MLYIRILFVISFSCLTVFGIAYSQHLTERVERCGLGREVWSVEPDLRESAANLIFPTPEGLQLQDPKRLMASKRLID